MNESLSKQEDVQAKANTTEDRKKIILVVDDEKPIRDILVYNLQKEGYEAIEAEDGEKP